MIESASRRGRIVTFYSYKGGTGRSMAVANVAWILASNRKRVLVIDWDLEAPGLHRYFHPFLEDKELGESPGLIDYFVDVAAAAREAATRTPKRGTEPWWTSWTSLLRYTYPLDYAFGTPGSPDPSLPEGRIDFVPAGRQGADYSVRVASFDWQDFYRTLGGGVLLEGVKERLRELYDYVLIDSRTGISDTAGICTVQMPDELVVCFTLNRQSIRGAAAVADSAELQRRRPGGEPGLRIWPVPTRVELDEFKMLDAARITARTTFQRYVGHLTRNERETYWGAVEVLYQAFYAYDEVLATFGDRPQQKASVLSSMEALTRYVTDGEVTRLARIPEEARLESLARFIPTARTREPSPGTRGQLYLSYSHTDRRTVDALVEGLKVLDLDVFWDQALLPGDDFRREQRKWLEACAAVLVVIGKRGISPPMAEEVSLALAMQKRIVPVLAEKTSHERVPELLRGYQWFQIRPRALRADVDRLAHAMLRVVEREAESNRPPRDPEDPQKGRWGGIAHRDGRILSATVQPVTKSYFQITLAVRATSDPPLKGAVEFHLHPTFGEPVKTVHAKDGVATLTLFAYGAFTVGAVADGGSTHLELDLAEDPSFPAVFRAR